MIKILPLDLQAHQNWYLWNKGPFIHFIINLYSVTTLERWWWQMPLGKEKKNIRWCRVSYMICEGVTKDLTSDHTYRCKKYLHTYFNCWNLCTFENIRMGRYWQGILVCKVKYPLIGPTIHKNDTRRKIASFFWWAFVRSIHKNNRYVVFDYCDA